MARHRSDQDRLAAHLLKRLRHRLEAEAIGRAVEADLFVAAPRTENGTQVQGYCAHPTLLAKPPKDIERLVRRLGSRHAPPRAGTMTSMAFEDGTFSLDEDGVLVSDERTKNPDPNRSGGLQAQGSADHRQLTARLLREVRASADRPKAAEVATVLLLARALADSDVALDEVLCVLRTRQPIVTVTAGVAGFEACFVDLLARGLILPGKAALASAYDLARDMPLRFTHHRDIRWRIVIFPGRKYDPEETDDADQRVGRAALLDYPILGIAESESRLPQRLKRAAQLALAFGPLDMVLIRQVIAAVLGEVPEGGISHADCSVLSLSDLAIAIRPGGTAGQALDVLQALATARRAALEAGEGDGASAGKSAAGKASSGTRKTGRGSDPGSGSEVVRPVALTGTSADRFVPRVETLSGYGEAHNWALSLKADLELWRTGELAWAEMSTKLLLSGPPGTGKTTFARALCNTLQVPLVVTSVATWLEPAYLGDVLRRMKAAFAEAEAMRPALLFIDELDGIGKRQDPSREYADYWNSLVNQLLTLLDGAVRSTGIVVVGATNHAHMIDPALLRSGRLEKHIVIPPPDTATLVGILRHHLRDDLGTVVASAPPRLVRGRGVIGQAPTGAPDPAADRPGGAPDSPYPSIPQTTGGMRPC